MSYIRVFYYFFKLDKMDKKTISSFKVRLNLENDYYRVHVEIPVKVSTSYQGKVSTPFQSKVST